MSEGRGPAREETPREPGAPRVIAADPYLVVIDKPAGWVAHAVEEGERYDISAWARQALGLASELAPLHRLDRATSGVLLLSPDKDVRAELGRAFAEGLVAKRYRALVEGHPHEKGIVRRALADRRRGGKPLPAVTRYRTLERLSGFALVEARPETGRTHQIRRHLAGLGHPIVGEERWRKGRPRRVPGYPGRLWLHALAITLPDGRTFEAPLAPELEAHLALLRAPRADS